MAMALAALTLTIRSGRASGRRSFRVAALLLFGASFLNVRIGPPAWFIGALYLACRRDPRYRLAATLAIPTVLGAGLGLVCLNLSPSYPENLIETIRMAMWFSPFVSATIFCWFLVPAEMRRSFADLPRWARTLACGAVGYLLAFIALYAAYQFYYGNLWRCLDVTVAIRMSDWALLGAAPGALWGLRAPAERTQPMQTGWVGLWLALFLALALSAFGQGWFMRFCPQRLMVFLGLPIAILAAQRLERLAEQHAVASRAITGVIVACGICSTAVAALCFQGPLGLKPGEGPFAYLHYECMTPADTRLLDEIPEGATVLTPPWSPIAFGEVVALRGDLHLVGGPGAMNIGGQPFRLLQERVDAFFSVDAPDTLRLELARDWCVDYVYCPDTCGLSDELLDEFRATPWLHLETEDGRGRLFATDASREHAGAER